MTFFHLFLALTGVSIPIFIFFVLVVGNPIITTLNVVPPPAYIIASIIGHAIYLLLTIVDPIVIMRNQDFREVIGKFCRKQKQVRVGGHPSKSSSTEMVQASNSDHKKCMKDSVTELTKNYYAEWMLSLYLLLH